jgi:hypothetical protein
MEADPRRLAVRDRPARLASADQVNEDPVGEGAAQRAGRALLQFSLVCSTAAAALPSAALPSAALPSAAPPATPFLT